MDVYVGFFTGKGRGRKSERERKGNEREWRKDQSGRKESRVSFFIDPSFHGEESNLHNFGKVNPSKFPWIPLIGTRRIGGSSFAIVARARMRERADKRIVRFFVQTECAGIGNIFARQISADNFRRYLPVS